MTTEQEKMFDALVHKDPRTYTNLNIRNIINIVLSAGQRTTQDTGERERLRTMYRYGYADNGNGRPSDPDLFISAVLDFSKAKEGK